MATTLLHPCGLAQHFPLKLAEEQAEALDLRLQAAGYTVVALIDALLGKKAQALAAAVAAGAPRLARLSCRRSHRALAQHGNVCMCISLPVRDARKCADR